jgi:hypothetical protein
MAALAVALLVVAATVAARVLATGSASYTEERRRERGHVPTAAPAPVVALPLGARRSRPEISRPRPVWWTILRNDLLALRRDTQRLLTFVFPLIVVGFNAYSILSRSSAQHTVALGTTLFLLVMVTLLLVNTTAPGTVNMGGRAILLFGLAPISLTEVLKAKWIGAGVLPLVLTEIALLVFAVYLRLPPSQFLLVGLALAALAVALAGVTLAANVAWPKLDAINPRRPASVTATIVSLATDAALSGYVLLMLVLDIFVWHGIRAGLAVVGLFLGLAAVIVACWTVTPALLQRLFYRADGVD